MTTRQAEDTEALDVAGLVRRAAAGDRWAWERLVDQYARLIWAITRDFKLVESDAADVAQVTWLRLLENIHKIENPDRVGSWLAATARNECLRNLAARKRVVLADDDIVLDGAAVAEPEVDERLLSAERAVMVREALSHLPWRWQRMLELLMSDPPASYSEISEQLGLPIGSIGPTRNRCLARLRVLLHASLGELCGLAPAPTYGTRPGRSVPGRDGSERIGVGDHPAAARRSVSPGPGWLRAHRRPPSGRPPPPPQERRPAPRAEGRPEKGQPQRAGNRRAGLGSRWECPYRASSGHACPARHRRPR